MSAVWDRHAAREVLASHGINVNTTQQDNILRELEACVRPATPQGIDRDALGATLGKLRSDEVNRGLLFTDQEWADRVLALVRPVSGIVLTPEEAQRAAEWWDLIDGRFGVTQADLDLVRKLEARTS